MDNNNERLDRIERSLEFLAESMAQHEVQYAQYRADYAQQQADYAKRHIEIDKRFRETDKKLRELSNLVTDIAEGTARLLSIVQMHERRIEGLEDRANL
jgi:uncharacterized protein YeeX (DUF496 family)